MGITDRLLAQVTPVAAQARILDLCIGAHWTLVTVEAAGDIRAGLASTLGGGSNPHHDAAPPVPAAGRLLDRSPLELLQWAKATSLLQASVGLAVLNALLPIDSAACVEINAKDILSQRGRGAYIAVVGHFPFIDALRQVARTLTVLELDPREGDVPAEKAPEVLPRADVVALTGTSLLNHTFDSLIGLCRSDAFVVVLGATTPLSPILFDVGVSAVSGCVISDPQAAYRAVSQGATFKQIPGKRLLTLLHPERA